jgi:hypothetical protein
MPDWRSLVGARLVDAGLDPVDEIDVVEEIAQHVEDRYDYLCSQGWSEAEAQAMSLRELDDDGLIKGIADTRGEF